MQAFAKMGRAKPIDDSQEGISPEEMSQHVASGRAAPVESAPNKIGLMDVEGEIPSSTALKSSFASGEKEKEAYLQKLYPGIEINRIETADTDKSGRPKTEQVVKLPGESKYRYINKPGLSWNDVAELGGAAPGAAAGAVAGGIGLLGGPAAIPAAAIGQAGGEVLRKEIGHGLLGIPRMQSAGEYATDVGLAGGLGAITQGAGNALFGKQILSGAAKPIVETVEQVAQREATPLAEVAARKGISAAAPSPQGIEDTISAPEFGANKALESPKNLADIKKVADEYKTKMTLPTEKRFQEIQNTIGKDLEVPLTPIHEEAAKSKPASDIFQLRKRIGDEAAQSLDSYDAGVKQSAEKVFDSEINKLGTRPKTANSMEAGQNLLSHVDESHQATKDALAPIFESFKALPPVAKKPVSLLKAGISKAPQLKEAMTVGQGGELVMKPYSIKSGITKQAYGLLSQASDALNSDRITFKDMQNIRSFLDQSVNQNNWKEMRPVQELRSVMLDHMDELMKTLKPKSDVYNTFKQYAINEKNLDSMEKILGGKVSGRDSLLLASPEKALDRIFASSRSIEAAKKVLGPEFENVLGDYIASIKNKATDPAFGTSSSKLHSLLVKNKGDIIKSSIPKTSWDRITAAIDTMRMFPDNAGPNPSGTATSQSHLGKYLLPTYKAATGHPLKGALKLAQKGLGLLDQKAAEAELTNIMAGKPGHVGLLKGVGNKLSSPAVRAAAQSGLIQEARKKLNE